MKPRGAAVKGINKILQAADKDLRDWKFHHVGPEVRKMFTGEGECCTADHGYMSWALQHVADGEEGFAVGFTEQALLGLWERDRVVYSVDPTLLDAILHTDLSRLEGQLADLRFLEALPHRCAFVYCPDAVGEFNYSEATGTYEGFLYYTVDGQVGVNCVGTHDNGDSVACMSIFSLDRRRRGWASVSALVEDTFQNRARYEKSEAEESHARAATSDLPRLVRIALGVFTYLASQNAEWAPAPHPVRRKKKSKKRNTTAPAVYDVGYRVGAELRAKHYSSQAAEPHTRAGSTVRSAHWRRAHAHLYWTGEGRTTPCIKWVAPTLVGTGPLKTTVHDVKAAS